MANRLEAKAWAIRFRDFGWTQQQIAESLRVPRTTVEGWLTSRPPTNGNSVIRKHNDDTAQRILTSSLTLFPAKYEDVDGQIAPESIDLILTDPPYLVSSNNITRKNQDDLQRDFGEWDKTPESQYQEYLTQWVASMAQHLKPGGSLYLFTGYKQAQTWEHEFRKNQLTFCNVLIWHRTNPAPQIRQTRWCPAFDMILFYSKGAPKTFNWLGQNPMHNVITNPMDSVITGGICMGNERQWHPTQKPRWLLGQLLLVSSLPGDTVLDPFAGSGSTGFAALQLGGLQTILVEPEPEYRGLIEGTAQKEFQCKVTLAANLEAAKTH